MKMKRPKMTENKTNETGKFYPLVAKLGVHRLIYIL